MNHNKEKILIIGGNGYVGKNLCNRLLTYKFDFHVFDLADIKSNTYTKVNIENLSEIENHIELVKPSIIVLLAASLNRSRDYEINDSRIYVNINGIYNVLLALKKINFKKIIYISTSEIYGNNQAPFLENMTPSPVSLYSISKLTGEYLVSNFCSLQSKNYTILRVFNIIGRNMPSTFFISEIISKLKLNHDILMTNGEQKRDFIDIDDVISSIISAFQCKSNNQIINVCSGYSISIKDLSIISKKILNSKSKLLFGAIPTRQNEIQDTCGDNSKLEDLLGILPKNNIEFLIRKAANLA